MVQPSVVPPLWDPMADANEARSAFLGLGDALASGPTSPNALGLTPERRKWDNRNSGQCGEHIAESQGFLHQHIISNAVGHILFCVGHNVAPELCDVQTVLHFLQSLLDAGRAASNLRVYLGVCLVLLLLS